jgi:hypothetical protein
MPVARLQRYIATENSAFEDIVERVASRAQCQFEQAEHDASGREGDAEKYAEFHVTTLIFVLRRSVY